HKGRSLDISVSLPAAWHLTFLGCDTADGYSRAHCEERPTGSSVTREDAVYEAWERWAATPPPEWCPTTQTHGVHKEECSWGCWIRDRPVSELDHMENLQDSGSLLS